MNSRHKLEKDFHDKREVDRNKMSNEEFEKKYPNKRLYKISVNTSLYIKKLLSQNLNAKTKLLDYCCGLGDTSMEAANYGAELYGIDISEESIKTTIKKVKTVRPDNPEKNFSVMNAENTTFEDNYFDVIICNGVLHHLDTSLAFKELKRIVKPTGIIICHESLGYNPLIQLYRNLTPKIRTAWETDHILKGSDFKIARKYFKNIDYKYFNLTSLITIPLIGTPLFSISRKICHLIDDFILKLPLIQLMAWQVVFILK